MGGDATNDDASDAAVAKDVELTREEEEGGVGARGVNERWGDGERDERRGGGREEARETPPLAFSMEVSGGGGWKRQDVPPEEP